VTVDWARRKLGAAAAIFDREGRVLLVRHTYRHFEWELPGGASEERESILDTVVREVVEETSIRVVPDVVTGVYYTADTDAHHFVFRCRVLDGNPVPSSPEVSECAYWPVGELPRPISDFTIRRIEDATAANAVRLPVVISTRRWLE
jgi:8-oxo-dGTP diphosphatase